MQTVLWIRANADGSIARRLEVYPFVEAIPLSCADGRILWQCADGAHWIDGYNERQEFKTHAEYPAFQGWTLVNLSDTRALWRHESGLISLWKLGDDGKQTSYVEHGPFGGWTVVNYAQDRILWRHETGRISLWNLDEAGNQTSYVEHGPFGGWTVVGYEANRLLWRHENGTASVWQVDASGAQVRYREFVLPGFAPHALQGDWLLWRSPQGAYEAWHLDADLATVGQLSLSALNPRIQLLRIEDETTVHARSVRTVLAPAGADTQEFSWLISGIQSSTHSYVESNLQVDVYDWTRLFVFNPTDNPIYIGIWLIDLNGRFGGGIRVNLAEHYRLNWYSIAPNVTGMFEVVHGIDSKTRFFGSMMFRTIGKAGLRAERYNTETGMSMALTIEKVE